MNTPDRALARRAVRLFPRHPLATREQVRHQRRQWLRAISILGDRWLLARKETRND